MPLPEVLEYAFDSRTRLPLRMPGELLIAIETGKHHAGQGRRQGPHFGLAKHTAPSREDDAGAVGATATEPSPRRGRWSARSRTWRRSNSRAPQSTPGVILFAYGCVLYEMATGRRAFAGASPASIIAAILDREPLPMFDAAPQDHPVRAALERIVRRCLVKKPEERWQSAADLADVLRWIAEGEPVVLKGSAAAGQRPAFRLVAVALAAAATGAAVLWGGLKWRAQPGPVDGSVCRCARTRWALAGRRAPASQSRPTARAWCT